MICSDIKNHPKIYTNIQKYWRKQKLTYSNTLNIYEIKISMSFRKIILKTLNVYILHT